VKESGIVAAVLCVSTGLSSMVFAQSAPDGRGGPNQRQDNPGLLGHNGAGQRDPAPVATTAVRATKDRGTGIAETGCRMIIATANMSSTTTAVTACASRRVAITGLA
jgi:hypothetical protein